METAIKNCPVEEEKEQEQIFDDVDKEISVINSLDNDLSSQLSTLLTIPEKVADHKACPEWIEPIKIACHNTKKYECSHSIGGVYCDRLLTQSHVEKILLESGVYLKDLSLSKICNASIMPIVAEHCINLTRLEFVHNGELKTNANHYSEAFKKLQNLKSIVIKLIHMQWCLRRKFPYEAINYLPEEMNEIHLIHEQGLPKKAVFFDLKRFKNLHSLTLSGCNLNKMLQAISEKTTLIYLDLKNFRVTKKCSLNIEHVFNQLVNLEHISITFNKFILNAPSSIFNTCKNIKYLDLPSHWSWDTIEILIENWENLKNLEHLTISWKLTHEIAKQLVKYCKKLKYLNISKIPIDDAMEITLQELTKLENLETLKIANIYNFSVETIIAISKNCKKLKILKMGSHRYLIYSSRNQPHPQSTLKYLSKLQYLEQLYLPSMTMNAHHERSIIAIVNKCKNLTKLDLSMCENITETTLIALTNSESLKELKVAWIDNVTDNFISKLKGLKSFWCYGCEKITDAGVIQLINNCPDLEYLNLRETSITINTIIGASEATKNRMNNIILTIDIKSVTKKSFKSVNKSIWLALAVEKIL